MGEQRITRAERFLGQQSHRAHIRVLASLVWDGELGSNVIVGEVLLATCLGTSGTRTGRQSTKEVARGICGDILGRRNAPRNVARLRRKLVDMMLLILFGYNENKSEVVDRSWCLVVMSKEGAGRRRIVAKLRRMLAKSRYIVCKGMSS